MKKTAVLIFSLALFLTFSCGCQRNGFSDQVSYNDSTECDNTYDTANEQENSCGENYNVYEITGDPIFSKIMSQNPIDESYNLKADERAATKDFVDIELEYIDVWKAEMDYSIDKFISLLSEEDRDDFLEIQNSWEKSAVDALAFENDLISDENYGILLGSGYQFLILSQKRELYRERTIRIKYLHYLIESSGSASFADIEKYSSVQFDFCENE